MVKYTMLHHLWSISTIFTLDPVVRSEKLESENEVLECAY